MKQNFISLILVILSLIAIRCTPESISVSNVTLNATFLEMIEGDLSQLTAIVSPSNAGNKEVTWSSSNVTVASVSSTGMVTAVGVGSAIITITTDDGGKTATCNVSVKARHIAVTSVELNKENLELDEGDSETLIATVKPENASVMNVIWSSSDDSVAKVDNNGKVTAGKAGKATITVKAVENGMSATCEVTTKLKIHDYVDLGLSVKWATMNVGASSITDYGDYFAWGDPEPYYEIGYAQENSQRHWKPSKSGGYSLDNYKYYSTEIEEYYDNDGFLVRIEHKFYTKYVPKSKADNYGYKGSYDNKIILDPEDDAAYVNWGATWRTPSETEWDELANSDNCTWTWVSLNGVKGYKVQSKKSGFTDKWIFLPAAGYRDTEYLGDVGVYGYYWSSSLWTSYPNNACNVHLFTDRVIHNYINRRDEGNTVRPVTEQ